MPTAAPVPAKTAVSSRDSTPRRFLRLPVVLDLVGLRKSQVYNLMHEGRFPTAYRLSARAVAWDADEVRKWCDSRPRATAENCS